RDDVAAVIVAFTSAALATTLADGETVDVGAPQATRAAMQIAETLMPMNERACPG
ncbi:MAG: hypothetical protein JWQ11_4505, partial [Rhizobacter sp.]|nr:hypothetical protein [Rhizobacter sp.]